MRNKTWISLENMLNELSVTEEATYMTPHPRNAQNRQIHGDRK
jgi:hypothetical protein